MIFKDILDEKTAILGPEINKLIELAWKNQAHPGDLLLISENGAFDEQIKQYGKVSDRKLNPHVVGPGNIGLSESTHYKFIHNYRINNIYEQTFEKYLDQIKYKKEKQAQIDALIDIEELSIQVEMLVYLKFWEADLIIKKFYQLVRLINGEPYDWHFCVQESARAKKKTGKRQEIIRISIRDRIKDYSRVLYSVFQESYKTQVRNAIAHSNYSFLNRTIRLHNYIKEDPHSSMYAVPFDDWISIFHNTLILYNEYIRMNNLINEFYGKTAMKNNNNFPVLITESSGKKYELILEYRPEFKSWGYKQG